MLIADLTLCYATMEAYVGMLSQAAYDHHQSCLNGSYLASFQLAPLYEFRMPSYGVLIWLVKSDAWMCIGHGIYKL